MTYDARKILDDKSDKPLTGEQLVRLEVWLASMSTRTAPSGEGFWPFVQGSVRWIMTGEA